MLVEYSSPNTGKPMHVGHIRSTVLGDAVANILQFTGYDVYRINYLGDTGLHLGKILSAFRLWGNRESLIDNPEEEMLRLYTKFCREEEKDQELTKKAKKALLDIENGETDSCSVLNFLNAASLKIFNKVYDSLSIRFDEITGQSNFSFKGKAIVKEALKKGLARYVSGSKTGNAEEPESGVQVLLEEYGLPPKIILRSDGTAIYSTQDLGAAIHRYEQHRFEKSIYVVADEQSLYFRQLFATLDKMGYPWGKKCVHLSFGLISMPDGIRMSTREGQIIRLEDVISRAQEHALGRIESYQIGPDEKEQISKAVGVGALKYMILSVDPRKNIVFSWDRAFDYRGRSGPYIQYTHTRCKSILDKAPIEGSSYNPKELSDAYSVFMVRKIARFPTIVSAACENLRPDLIARYSYEVCKAFNDFYSNKRVLQSPEQSSRLALTKATLNTISNSAKLLGLGLPIRM